MTDQPADALAVAVTRAADGELHDPSDALTYLDLAQFTVGDDGTVDQAAVSDAIAELISRRPYLAAPTAQLTRADLENMTPAQIVQAREDGRLRRILAPVPSGELAGPELRIRQLENDGITQLTRADLKTMSTRQITEARREGRLTRILTTPNDTAG